MKIFIDNSVVGYDPSTEGIFYKIYYEDGTTSGTPVKVTSTTPEAKGQVSFQINITHNANDFYAVQPFMGSGTVKSPVIEFNIATTFNPEPLTVNFTATIADGDNDTKSDPFSIHVAAA